MNATETPAWYKVARLASGVPVSSVLLLLDVFLFVLLVIGRNSAVIKSRGIVTYLALLVHITCGITTIVTSTEVSREVSCYGVLIVIYPFYISLIFMYILQYLRFVLLRQSQQMKQQFAENKSLSTVTLKVVALLSSPWLVIPCIILVGLLWNIVLWVVLPLRKDSTGTLGVYSPTMCNNSFLTMTFVFSGSLLALALTTCVLFVIVSIPLICSTSVKKVFYEEDAYLFQTELIVAFFCNIVFTIINYAFFFAVPHSSVFFATVNVFLLNILNSLISPGFVILLSIIFAIRHKQKMAQRASQRNSVNKFDASIDTIKTLLENETTRALLKQFCKTEFSVENVLCFEEVTQYAKQTNDQERLRHAKSINDTFVKNGSVLEVNTTQDVRDEVQQALAQQLAPLNLFDRVKDAVGANLLDTYARFYHSSGFQHFLNDEKSEAKT